MTDSSNTTPKKRLRKTHIVLVTSLALNFAVVGVVAGTMLRGGEPAETQGRVTQARDFGFSPHIGALSLDDRRDVGKAFMRQAGSHRAARLRVQRIYEDMIKSLIADPFDLAVFEALLEQQQTDLAEKQRIGAELLTQKVSEMDDQARAEYASRLDQMLKRPQRAMNGSGTPPHDVNSGQGGKKPEPK